MKTLLIFLTLLVGLTVFSQSGKVVDNTGESLPFVNIYSPKYDKGTTSDFEGNFYIDVPLGTKLVFSFISYDKDTLEAQPNMNVIMRDNIHTLDEIEIVVEKRVGGETILLMDRKETTEIESSIGSTELTKKNISNAEDGLKKISGVTIKSSKINVRGLDDRYNQVTVNKFPLPSNNTDQKNIDVGLIPKSFIGNMKVRKTYTPNQWSNIAGAQIDINTDNIDTGYIISYVSDWNSNTTNRIGNGVTLKQGKSFNNFKIGFTVKASNNYLNTRGFTRLIDRQGNTQLDYNFLTMKSNFNGFTSLQTSYRPNSELRFKTVSMYVTSINKNTTYMEGTHFDYNNDIFTSRVTPLTSHLFLQQLIGEWDLHKFTNHVDLSYSMVSSGEKDRNQFVYLVSDRNYKFNNIDKLDNHHFWSSNLEHRYGASLNSKYESNKITSEFGYSFLGSYTKFDYLQEFYNMYSVNLEYESIDPYNPYDYINESNHKLSEVNNPASLVEGQTLIHGVYNVTNIKLNKFLISAGLRFENSYQGIFYKDQIQPNIERSHHIDSYEFLPSMVFKYEINERNQIKLSTSKTTIRPRFRELTPFLYTEMFAGSKIQGNPELKNSSVYNGDLSYEIYPNRNQMITFTGFGKYILSPIERVNVATASGRLETYQNGDEAYVLGGEIETKLKLKDFTLDYNLTVMYSQISLSDNGSSSIIVTNPQRELQGSTPILSNLDLFYKKLGLVYTYTGKKLFSAGIQGLGDVYQTQRHQLNLVYRYEVDKFNFNISINNILNSPYELIQGSDNGVREINKYRNGLDVSMGLTYSFS